MKLNELQAFQGTERATLRQWLLSQGMEQSGVTMLFRLFDKKKNNQGPPELQALGPIEDLLHNLSAQGISGFKRADQIAKQGQKKRDQKPDDKVAPIKKSSGSLDGIDMPLAASKDYDADPIEEAKCGCCGNEITDKGCGCDADCPHCGGKGKVNESLGYAMPGQDEDKETVTYSKTKKQGDASVTVSANADSMDELHDILRLAGITLPKSDKADEPEHDQPEHDHEEPEAEVCDDCGEAECGCDAEEPEAIVVKGLPQDDKPNYSTDKEVLINYLKDKLTKSVG